MSNFIYYRISRDEYAMESGVRFVSKTSRYWHKLQHSLETKCFYCDFVADNLKAFQKHAKEVHGKQDEDMGNDTVKCMYCEKILTKGAIYSHRQFHITQPVKCKICYVSAKSKHSLYYHVRELHKSDLEKSFLEKGCPSNMLTLPCEKCDLKFLTEKLLQKHNSRDHGPQKQVSPQALFMQPKLPSFCILCHFEFPSNSKLAEHRVKTHTTREEIATFDQTEIDDSKFRMTCSYCEKKFMNITCLKYHRQFTHKGEAKLEEVNCEFCNKTFKWKNKANLKKHIQSLHNICDYDIDEFVFSKKSGENNASINFMNVLNSLTQ